MTEHMHEETKNEDAKAEENRDTVSRLFEERDQECQPETEKISQEKTSATQKIEEGSEPEVIRAQGSNPSEKKSDLKDGDGQP